MSELSTDVLALSSFPDQSTRTVLVKKVRKDPVSRELGGKIKCFRGAV